MWKVFVCNPNLWAAELALNDPREPKKCTLGDLGIEPLPRFHEKTPREGRKNEICGGRRKKRQILGLPPFGAHTGQAPHRSGPTLRAPTFTRLAKFGLTKFCQKSVAKMRSKKCGLMRSRPKRCTNVHSACHHITELTIKKVGAPKGQGQGLVRAPKH